MKSISLLFIRCITVKIYRENNCKIDPLFFPEQTTFFLQHRYMQTPDKFRYVCTLV